MENTQRLDYIDGLRGLAALMVICVHSANFVDSLLLPGTILSWLKLGRFGVQIFYIISAFTIMMSIDRLKNRGGYGAFYLRRAFRILPVWYIALILMYFYNLFVREITGSLGSVVIHVFLLHGIFPQYISDIIGHGWSVGVEILFYILIPSIIRRFGYRLENYLRLIFWNVLSVWCLNLVGSKVCITFFPDMDNTFWYLWLPNQLPAFLIGICLYLIVIRKQKIEDWKNVSKYLIGILILVFLSVSEVLTRSMIEAGLILILSMFSSKIISNSFFRYIGKVSYGIYLFHMLVIFFLQDSGFMEYSEFVSLIMYFIVVPIVSIGFGMIAYYFVERPFISMERKIENKFFG